MNFQARGDILDSSGVVLPDDLLAETPSNQLSTPASTSEKINYSEPGLQQTSIEGPELPLFAGSSIANCDSRIENSQDQTFTPMDLGNHWCSSTSEDSRISAFFSQRMRLKN